MLNLKLLGGQKENLQLVLVHGCVAACDGPRLCVRSGSGGSPEIRDCPRQGRYAGRTGATMRLVVELFALGEIVATANAVATIPTLTIHAALDRHSLGDWGSLTDDDRQANEQALREGERLLSVYATEGGTTFWIITERDRSYTTILLPEDY